MSALLPALLVALFACWSGTFHGGASWSGALAGDLAVVAFALGAASRLRDPLRLGRGAELLLWAFVITLAASAVASAVPRAGLEPLALFPAFVLLPSAVEHRWRDADRRRAGIRSLAVVAGAVAAWALFDAASSGSWRAAAPLGHHGALAVWLLFVLPFAAFTLRERGRWRAVGVVATVASGAALLATRSLVGSALLVVQAALLLRARRAHAWALATAAVIATGAAVLQAPRLLAIVSGEDASVAARGAYFAAGLAGLRARPALGWGPGSVGWTAGAHLRPTPGRNPPGEVVSYLHFLPLDLAYQLGVAAALLAVAVVAAFLVARRSERATAVDPALLQAAMAALGPGLAGLCLAGFQPLAATMVAASVAAGAALAATPASTASPAARSRRAARAALLLYTAGAIVVVAPVRRAQRFYDRARLAERPFALLASAADLDSAFPLYAARRAWTSELDGGNDASAAGEALRAAERAPGVAALWLAAGLQGADAGEPWSEATLRRACDLDPLGALAPFRLATLDPAVRDAAVTGARALLAEPRLAAATDWQGREALYALVLDQVVRWPGIDDRWRGELVAALRSLPPAWGPRPRPFFLEIDGAAPTSLSLFVFRRRPWPTAFGAIDLDVDRLRRITVGSAALRADTEPWAFPRNECGGAEPPR
jgi:hypothetical protein